MPPLIRALRPQEWIKNLLVFAGVLFSGRLDESGAIGDALLTFAAFCAIASAGYLLNDLRDREHDRRHPEKRNRPIASGAVSPATAAALAAVLAVAALAIGFLVEPEIAGLVALYGVITTAYSLVAQAPGDHRRDDDRLAVHPPSGRRRGRGRRPRLGVPADLHRDAGSLPRVHEAPPGGDARGVGPDRGCGVAGDPARARALLAAVSRSDDRDGDRVGDHLATSSTRSTHRASARRCSPPRPRCSTGSSATCT